MQYEPNSSGGRFFARRLGTVILFLLLTVLFSGAALCQPVQRENKPVWAPIPPEDLALEDNPEEPGSSAMILLKKETRDHKNKKRTVYIRIKIFQDAGRHFGDIEIPYTPRTQKIVSIQARTIRADGTIVPFRGAIFEKTLARRKKFRFLAKTFALPDVAPGSIIEYRYVIKNKTGVGLKEVWPIQESLFIRKLTLRLIQQGNRTPQIYGHGIPEGTVRQPDGEGVNLFTLLNLPAIENEPHMIPEASRLIRYHVDYPLIWFGGPISEFWARPIQKFIGSKGKVRAIVNGLVSPKDEAEVKVRKIYEAVQGLRNLSYEERFTKKERKKEHMKERKSPRDVWRLGYGTSAELANTFIAFCRSAGLKADAVMVIERDSALYDNDTSVLFQTDGRVVAVDLDDETTHYYDPGSRFVPFGMLSWEKQGVTGIRLGKKALFRINTPMPVPEENRSERRITMELDSEGNARVRVVVRLTGQFALARRNSLFDLTPAQRLLQLKEDLEKSFPLGEVEEVKWKGEIEKAGPLEYSYRVMIPRYANRSGSRLIFRPLLYASRSPFTSWKREQGIYFHYPYATLTEVRVAPPDGFELEQAPDPARQKTPMGEHSVSWKEEDGSLFYSRELTLRTILMPKDDYPMIKRFFDKQQRRDNFQVVYKQTSGGSQ